MKKRLRGTNMLSRFGNVAFVRTESQLIFIVKCKVGLDLLKLLFLR